MIKISMKVKGLDKLVRNLRNLRKDVLENVLPAVINRESGRVLAVAQDRVSVDTGQLRRNVEILKPRIRLGEEISGGFVFKQRYAAVHHEGMPAAGGNAWPGGGSRKFAETALKENTTAFARAIQAAVRRRLA